jgi:hypothetical protein
MVFADVSIRGQRILGAYAFNAASDPTEGLLIFVEPEEEGFSLRRERVDTSERGHVRPAIGPEQWAVDSVQALGAAYEEHGGKEFLREHPEVNRVLVQLRPLGGSAADRTGLTQGRLHWRVAFYALPTPSYDVYLDPLSGELLAIDVREGEMELDKLNVGEEL